MFNRRTTQYIAEHKAQARSNAIILYQVASVLSQKRFKTLLEHPTGMRFDWAGKALMGKLRHDLVFQLDSDAARDTSLAIEPVLERYMDRFSRYAQVLEYEFDLSIRQKDKQFRAPSGHFLDRFFELFSRPDKYLLHVSMSEILSQREASDVRNAFQAFRFYARALDTLFVDTGNKRFEAFLASLSESYMTAGYPKDVLAHDAHLVRAGEHIKAIYYVSDYCSSWALTEENRDLEAHLMTSPERKAFKMSA